MDGPGVGTMAIQRNSWTGPSKVSGDMTMRRTKDALALATIAGDTCSGTISAIRALVPRKVNAARAGIAATSLRGSRLVVPGAICRGNIFPWGPCAAQNSLGVHVPRKVNAAGASSAASFLRGSTLAALRATCNTTLTHLLPKVGVPGGGLLWSSLRGCSSLALGPIHICIISAINLPRNPCAVQSQRSWSWQLDAACTAELPHGFGSADLMAMGSHRLYAIAGPHSGNKLWKQFHSSAMQASLPLVCAACFPTEFGRHPFSKCNKLQTKFQ
ncbi:hypothetical protein EDD15DRAFT_2204864 [Pisolithus albus]|nr:hypothetical protein EDD15DRAFT_2204864 [Pisolithus albus]